MGREAFTYKVVRRQAEHSARSIIKVFAQDFDAATEAGVGGGGEEGGGKQGRLG